MPKLMIDLASPSTGGSTDVNAGGITKATFGLGNSTKEIFKNNLARVAKNSATAQIHTHKRH